jgi:peptidoglycan/LPS O-acetylase OafA/YrhL
MMSAAVIAPAHDERFRRGMTIWRFTRARAVRLYPLYLLGTLIGITAAAGSLLGNNPERWDLTSLLVATTFAMLAIPDLYGRPASHLHPLNAPSWSLFFEEMVNLAFGVFWRGLTTRRLVWIGLISGSCVALTIAARGDDGQGYTFATFLHAVARTIFGFTVGVLIARRQRAARRGTGVMFFLAICIIVMVAIAGSPLGTNRAWWGGACVLLILPLVVYTGTVFDPRSWLQPTASILGLSSYAVCVLHAPLSTMINSILRRLAHSDPLLAAPYIGISVLAGIVLCSRMVDHYFDVPVRRALSRNLSPH